MSDAASGVGGAPNLVLAGFMGTGKSTVGALLAARLGWSFVDTDAVVEQMTGMPVKDIFAAHGEAHFRLLERQACIQAAGQRHAVIATGGGALLDVESRRALEESGVVILLTCDRERLLPRLEESARRGARPMLGEMFAERIDELLLDRQTLYNSFPVEVDTGGHTPEEVARQVVNVYAQVAEGRGGLCAG